jgi:hypothetical protein
MSQPRLPSPTPLVSQCSAASHVSTLDALSSSDQLLMFQMDQVRGAVQVC